MKKGRMLRDSVCGLKKGDIVDIVEKKDNNEYTVYKKGIDGHNGSGNIDICKNLECWWVWEHEIEIIDEVDEWSDYEEEECEELIPEPVETSNETLREMIEQKDITIRALIEYIKKLEG